MTICTGPDSRQAPDHDAMTIRVPVRTWREKAILAAAIASPLGGLWEAFDAHIGFSHDHLMRPDRTNQIIDDYFARRPEIVCIEAVLRHLRAITPGPEMILEVPVEVDVLKQLDAEIQHLASTDVDELLGDHPSRREAAKALIEAIDLRAAVGGGDA